MRDGIGRHLSRDEGDGAGGIGVVRETGPLGELLDGELAGEPGAPSCAAEVEGQLVGGSAGFTGVGGLLLCHSVSVGGRSAGDQVQRPYVVLVVRSTRSLLALVVRVLYGRCTGPGPYPGDRAPR